MSPLLTLYASSLIFVRESSSPPGEVLYIPSYWFHYIQSLDFSVQCNTRSGSPPNGDGEGHIAKCMRGGLDEVGALGRSRAQAVVGGAVGCACRVLGARAWGEREMPGAGSLPGIEWQPGRALIVLMRCLLCRLLLHCLLRRSPAARCAHQETATDWRAKLERQRESHHPAESSERSAGALRGAANA